MLDAIESWVAGQGYWIQVAVLLAVLLPLCFWLAGVIDRLVEKLLGRGGAAGTTPAAAGSSAGIEGDRSAGDDVVVADGAAR